MSLIFTRCRKTAVVPRRAGFRQKRTPTLFLLFDRKVTKNISFMHEFLLLNNIKKWQSCHERATTIPRKLTPSFHMQ